MDTDEDLSDRLDSFLGDLLAEPLPASLEVVDSEAMRHRERRAASRRSLGLGGLAAAAVLIVVMIVSRGGDERDVTTGGDPGTSVVAPTTAPDAKESGRESPTPDPGEPRPGDTAGEGSPSTTSVPATAGDGTSEGTSDGGGGAPETTASPGTTATTVPSTTPTTTTPTTPTTGSEVLFEDHFTSGSVGAVPPGWTVDTGGWELREEATIRWMASTQPAPTENRASAGSGTWTDYTVSASVRIDSGGRKVGLGARYRSANEYVFCKVDVVDSMIYLGEYRDGTIAPLAQVAFSAAVGSSVPMSLTVSGSSASCRVGSTSASVEGISIPSGRIASIAEGMGSVKGVRVVAG